MMARGARRARRRACSRRSASSRAAAGEAGMVGGQALDLAAEGTRATLAARARHPSPQDRRAAARGGAGRRDRRRRAAPPAAAPHDLRRARSASRSRSPTTSSTTLGDRQADGRTDAALGKATYPGALGLDGAAAPARRARDAARRAPSRPLGRSAEPLRAIAALRRRARPTPRPQAARRAA